MVVLTRRACWDALPGRSRRLRGIVFKHSHRALWIAVDLPAAPRMFSGRRLMRTHYLLWQVLVLIWLRARRGKFDLVHHLTFVAAWFPPFAALSGTPVVWGPIGTNPPLPEFYRRALGWRGRVRAAVRRIVTVELVRRNPLLRFAASGIVGGFAITPQVRDLLPPGLRQRIAVHPAIAIDAAAWRSDIAPMTDGPVLFVGRTIDIKLPRLAYDAARLALAKRCSGSAILIGEGLPEAFAGKPYSQGLEVREHVGQAELRQLYSSASVFLFPSMESSGFVTLEAMANGLPVVCLEASGAAFFAGSLAASIVAPHDDYEATTRALADALVNLLDDPATRQRMSLAARERVEQFGWEQYEPFLAATYREARLRSGRERNSSLAITE